MENNNEPYELNQGENKDQQQSSILTELLVGGMFVAMAVFGYYIGTLLL